MSVVVPLLLAVGVGWQVGDAVNRHDSARETTGTPRDRERGDERAWSVRIPERFDNFFALSWAGALASGGFVTLVWMFFLFVTPVYPVLPLGVVVGEIFPMLVIASYFGCLAVTGVPFVAEFWRETTRQLDSTDARQEHRLRVLFIAGGFFVLVMTPWEVLPLPLNFRMPVSWSLAFLYVFFALPLLPFLNMARPLTTAEYAAVVPEDVDADPHTTVWVGTVGIRATAMATGVWPFRRIFIGEDLLESPTISDESVKAILYHERGHHELGHIRAGGVFGLLFFCGVGGFLAVVSPSLNQVVETMGVLAVVSRFGLVWWVRRAELAADEFEQQEVGSEAAITALRSVAALRGGDDESGSESRSLPWGTHVVVDWLVRVHPSVDERIKAIEERESNRE